MQQRLSRRHERYLYLTGTLLAVTGVAWLIDHYLLRTPGMPTLGPHPSEAWWMRLHGAAVIGFLVAFGALLPGHIVQNWRQRANRYSGLTMVIVVSLLALSGYGLYYLVDDQQRTVTSALHWVTGLVACAALLLHVVLGKRLAARARARRMEARPHRPRPGAPRASRGEAPVGEIPAGPT